MPEVRRDWDQAVIARPNSAAIGVCLAGGRRPRQPLAFFGPSIRQSSRLVLQPSLGHLLDLNVWRRIEPPNPAAWTLHRKLTAEAAVSERNDGRAFLAIYGSPVVGGSPARSR